MEISQSDIKKFRSHLSKLVFIQQDLKDIQNSIVNPNDPKNKFRCAYAKACGIEWTELDCT